ncbi:Elongation factor Ts, mitochondrial [Ceratobasidium sp. 428]|nr:Elongation factor Ts, mitochondrial [Ceratobasidium sp. 428]
MLLRARLPLRTTWSTSCIHTSLPRSAELKASIKLVAEIRKITDNQVSFAKAKEALLATQNDFDAALAWLEEDSIVSGAKKAAKVASRIANDGLVGIAVLSDGSSGVRGAGATGVRAAMVEVNCETDFVARNELFTRLVADIAHTAAYLGEEPSSSPSSLTKSGFILPFPVDMLSAAPLISTPSSSSPVSLDPSRTVSSVIQEATAKIGEKISLRRACTFIGPALPPNSTLALRVGNYIHQSSSTQPQAGKIGTLVALALKSNRLPQFMAAGGDNEVRTMGRALARQIVGLNAQSVEASSASRGAAGDASSTVLYAQPFMMRPGGSSEASVRTSLNEWAHEKGLVSVAGSSQAEEDGLEVLEFVKWNVGEGIEKSESEGGFAEEVRRLSG